MKQESNQTTRFSNTGSPEALKVRKILLLMLRNWHIYILAIVLFSGGAYLYLRHKFPTYSTQALILIEEESSPSQDILEGFSMRAGVQNLDNQVLVLSSFTMIRKAIEDLPFEIDVYRKGLLSRSSYYPLNPLRIEPGSVRLLDKVEFVFEYIGDEKFELSTSSKSAIELDTVVSFGEKLFLGEASFTIFPVLALEDAYMTGDKIYFQFFDKDRLTETYAKRLMVENATRDGSIVRLSLEGTNRAKGVVFLDKLTEVFIENNLEKKNLEAERIIDFIEGQLKGVQDSLRVTETRLQNFRSRNQIMDVSAQTQQIINQAVVLDNEKARLSLEKDYYEYLNEYLAEENNENKPVAPASMGIQDPNLANLIQEYSVLQSEYFSSGVGERNPLQGQLDMRIKNTKQSIRETLSGIMLRNQMGIDENERQIARLNVQASNLPAKEQQLLGFQREFNLNNVLYTFLLERRAEAQIQKASNSPDHELIDRARSQGIVSPIPISVLAFALILAIGLPTLIILLVDLLHNIVNSEEDLFIVGNIPVIAQFPNSRLKYNTMVLTEPNSRISEAFRSLRIRMDFFTREEKSSVILLTSSMPGEGKTFSAINLASAYSLAGKKTLMIEMDLRRPALSKSFDFKGSIGLTEYLIGKCQLKDIIYDTGFENLYVLPSGIIPPNPGELISSEKTMELFSKLKEEYDFIIVDSPPIGVVSDIYPITKLATLVMLVVRHGHTRRNVLSATLSELQSNGIEELSVIVNGIRPKGSSYRYSYKYKYEYKSDSKASKLSELLKTRLRKPPKDT